MCVRVFFYYYTRENLPCDLTAKATNLNQHFS